MGLISGKYQASPPTLADGNETILRTDNSGKLLVNTGGGGASPTSYSHQTAVTVGTVAVQVFASAPSYTYQMAVVADTSNTGTIYLGGSGVTTGNGVPLAAGGSIVFDLVNNPVTATTIYAIGSAGGQQLRIAGN